MGDFSTVRFLSHAAPAAADAELREKDLLDLRNSGPRARVPVPDRAGPHLHLQAHVQDLLRQIAAREHELDDTAVAERYGEMQSIHIAVQPRCMQSHAERSIE